MFVVPNTCVVQPACRERGGSRAAIDQRGVEGAFAMSQRSNPAIGNHEEAASSTLLANSFRRASGHGRGVHPLDARRSVRQASSYTTGSAEAPETISKTLKRSDSNCFHPPCDGDGRRAASVIGVLPHDVTTRNGSAGIVIAIVAANRVARARSVRVHRFQSARKSRMPCLLERVRG
jgi:hypothetical protein